MTAIDYREKKREKPGRYGKNVLTREAIANTAPRTGRKQERGKYAGVYDIAGSGAGAESNGTFLERMAQGGEDHLCTDREAEPHKPGGTGTLFSGWHGEQRRTKRGGVNHGEL